MLIPWTETGATYNANCSGSTSACPVWSSGWLPTSPKPNYYTTATDTESISSATGSCTVFTVTSDVQAMVSSSSPASNDGWVILPSWSGNNWNSISAMFYSRESGAAGNLIPNLTIM